MNRIEKFIEIASKNPEFEGALVTSPQNRFYMLNMHSSAGTILMLKDAAYFIIDFRYIELAQKSVKNAQVIMQTKLHDQINELLEKHGVKKLWIEESMSVGVMNAMKANLKAEIVTDSPMTQIINEMRQIKSREELEIIKTGQAITDAGFSHMLTQLAAGRSERDLAIELETFMRKQGASGIAFSTILVSGKNSSLPHGVPGNKLLEKGDFVTMDFGAAYGGYCTDMTRTVAIGHVTDEMKHVYNTVLEAQLMALAEIKAGKVCHDIDKIARDHIYANGYEGRFGHSLGHSFGIDVHETPGFAIGNTTILQPGMMLSVEPGIYLPDKFGVRIEDTIYVTEDGCENITHSPKELIIL